MTARKLIPLGMLAALVAGLAFWFPRNVSADLLRIGDGGDRTAEVHVDDTPLERRATGAAPTSYADVIERAASSVVNIVSTRHPQAREMAGDPSNPFLKDPFLRRYFEAPEDGQGGKRDPRERRQQRPDQESLGSGVIVTSDGYILTNNHVIENADEIRVLLGDNSQEYQATLVGTDPQSDVALLKIEATDLPAITIANSSSLRVGDVVFAIGNPMGVGQTVTQGIISAQGRAIGIVDYEDFIQTDAAINPGNSGGALIDAQGRLIGINTAIVSRSGGNMGIGFAIPANQARQTMESLLEDGRISRGYLGVTIQDIDHELQEAFGLSDMEGALVNTVVDDGSAAAAGVQTGDVIREFNGKKIRDVRHLRMAVSGTRPGSDVEFKVWREGRLLALTATLKELPGSDQVADGSPQQPGRQESILRGVQVEVYNAQRHADLDLPKATHGLVVVGVEPGSAAAAAGMRAGDLIEQINRRRIETMSDARDAVKTSDPDRVLLFVSRGGNGRFIVVDNTAG